MSSLSLLTKPFFRINSINSNRSLINVLMNKTNPLFVSNINLNEKRYLFSDQVLGIDNYLSVRRRITAQFADKKSLFFERMNEYVNSETNMIFTEDLKNVIYMADNDEEEIKLLIQMIKKFNSQNQSLRFGDFTFGPIVLRFVHHIQNPDLALQLIKDPELKAFLGQITTIVVALDLLFKQERYDDVLSLFDFTNDQNYLNLKYPRDCSLLAIAAAYKLNTPQSFDKALEIMKGAKDVASIVTRKTVCLFAGLALKQNQPNIALEVLSSIPQANYITVKNLRLMALSDIKRFDDVFSILRVVLNIDVAVERRPESILEETVEKIKHAINETTDKQLITSFSQIERNLIEGNHIQKTSLDEVLCTPVLEYNRVNKDENKSDFHLRRQRAVQVNRSYGRDQRDVNRSYERNQRDVNRSYERNQRDVNRSEDF